MDTYHYLFVASDIVISGGENVSSLFVESQLTTHPDILEVAVVARASEKWGERPHAFVVLKGQFFINYPQMLQQSKFLMLAFPFTFFFLLTFLDSAKWHGKHEEFEKNVKAHSRGKMPGFAIPEVPLLCTLSFRNVGLIFDF